MKKVYGFWVCAVGVLAMAASACSSADTSLGGDPEEQLEPEDLEGLDGKAEAWNSQNNPAFVDPNFSYFVHQLPVEGNGPVPIPGDYWATQKDNLNARWEGESSLSPAEKYAAAFNKPDVPKQITLKHGILSASNRKECTQSTECTDLKDGSACAIPRGETKGKCIPGWWGICHGWAVYALSEKAARYPVTRKSSEGADITFYPGDLEGLMSLLYTNVPTSFLSTRCNKDEPPTDSMGRLLDGECRDMNPGSFHVIATNMLGLRKKGFVLDQTYDDEVWNQPAYGYKIANANDGKLKEITKAEAVQLLGADMKFSSLFATVELKKEEQKAGEYTAPSAAEYTVKLSGTGDADLYIKKGSAPTKDSYDCRPYGGTADEECKVTLAAGEKVYWMVLGYGDTSKVQLGIGLPGVGEYTYNTAAKRFFHVEMDFSFVVESRPAKTSHVDSFKQYLHYKHYSYILETDDGGKILGGEWVGASMKDHPDFVWWSNGTPRSSQANGLITYEEVKKLNEEAAEKDIPPPAGTEVVMLENRTITSSGAWKSAYASLPIEEGVKKVTFTMTDSGGDPELYVKADSNPTVNYYICKAATTGTKTETCSVNVTPGKTYFVRARTKTTTTVSIKAVKN
jgi:hypothetical protein